MKSPNDTLTKSDVLFVRLLPNQRPVHLKRLGERRTLCGVRLSENAYVLGEQVRLVAGRRTPAYYLRDRNAVHVTDLCRACDEARRRDANG